jgi:hypothetical protein
MESWQALAQNETVKVAEETYGVGAEMLRAYMAVYKGETNFWEVDHKGMSEMHLRIYGIVVNLQQRKKRNQSVGGEWIIERQKMQSTDIV